MGSLLVLNIAANVSIVAGNCNQKLALMSAQMRNSLVAPCQRLELAVLFFSIKLLSCQPILGTVHGSKCLEKVIDILQIAGSYRGSYFSMDGFWIAEIGCRCRLVSQACLPS